ncbi:MAG: pyruvate kinase alpha/beta domain-containing protein [Candidatus Helarchaeota archaeon]
MTEVIYFNKSGPENTENALKAAKKYAEENNIKKIVIATTTGNTGVKATEILKGFKLIFVTHAYNFMKSGEQELNKENKTILEKNGKIVTSVHALSGVARSIRSVLKTWDPVEMIAYALRVIFCQGMKVVLEIVLMATDAGLINYGEEVIAIAGTGKGADTVCLIKAADTSHFFDLRLKEIICKPRNF